MVYLCYRTVYVFYITTLHELMDRIALFWPAGQQFCIRAAIDVHGKRIMRASTVDNLGIMHGYLKLVAERGS